MNKIYTKKGDKGMTGTFLGRMSKSDVVPEALGTIDELNSAIGLSRFETGVDEELKRVQRNLLTIGSCLSGSRKKIDATETKYLERLIDKLTDEMPKLTNFIYPVGQLQLARAICRRAERAVVAALQIPNLKSQDTKNILKYLNRLSDALFTMARWVNFKKGIEEEVWK